MITNELKVALRASPAAAHVEVLTDFWTEGEISDYTMRRKLPRAWRYAGGGFAPGDLVSTIRAMEALTWSGEIITDNRRRWDSMSDEIHLYRGGCFLGPCWTTQLKTAVHFLNVHSVMRKTALIGREEGYDVAFLNRFLTEKEPTLFEIVVPKEHCVAYLTKRGEAEVVIGWEKWKAGTELRRLERSPLS